MYTINSSDPADELVKVTKGKVVPGRQRITKSGIPRKLRDWVEPSIGAVFDRSYENNLRKVY